MLKLLLQQFGVDISQEMVEKMFSDVQGVVDRVQKIEASIERCETMLDEVMRIRNRSFGGVAKAYAEEVMTKDDVTKGLLGGSNPLYHSLIEQAGKSPEEASSIVEAQSNV